MKHLKKTIDFSAPSEKVATALIGCTLMVDGIGGIIVETEAYDRTDPASHSYPGPTPRNAVMFDEPARLYVYRSYGIHWCVNIVCREKGHGAAVLLRAIQPTRGIETMCRRRNMENDRLLCAGPGRLCQALGITDAFNGLPLDSEHITFLPAEKNIKIITGPRIGITKAVETPWRFGLSGSPYLSRPFKKTI